MADLGARAGAGTTGAAATAAGAGSDASSASPALQQAVSSQSLECQPPPDVGEDSVDNIRVYVRIRPPTDREQAAAPQPALAVDFPTHSVLLRGDQARAFTFDGVLGDDSTQEEVFDLVGRGIGASCLSGYNGSVYVYGQTGVGKTYTMSGPVTSVQSMQFDDRRGLICRILEYVFAEIHRRQAQQPEGNGSSYLCRCAFLEIYKEQITDLLEPSNVNLQIREDMNRGVYVERLSEPIVSSLTEAFQHLWRGLQQRHIGATHMNERSSRSHAVFTLSVEVAKTRAGVTSTRVAHLSLVDLAGSERQQGMLDPRSGISAPYQSLRVKEAGAINKSLSALTNVIMSLSRDERSRRRSGTGTSTGDSGRRPFVHYRDSKLTFLLRDSLGGNSKTVIVANISPSSVCLAETLSTLKFAARAKHIRCAAVRNEEFTGTVESLMQEVKVLRLQLATLSGSGGPGLATTQSAASLPESNNVGGGENAREDEQENVLYSRRRVRRLEVLLAAALERESYADHRRHQLHRLAEFLEDLDFRKTQDMKKLYKEYAIHTGDLEPSLVSPESEDGQDLVEKLTGFRQLLGNLAGSTAVRGAAAVPSTFGAGSAPPPLLSSEASFAGAAVAAPVVSPPPAGTPPHPRSRKRGTSQSSQRPSSPPAGGSGCGALPSPPMAGLTSDLADEAVFLRDENQRLRQQLEQHPEIGRLTSENEMLRQRLKVLDQGLGGRGMAAKLSQRSPSNSSDEDEADGLGGSDPLGGQLTSAMLLRFAEADEDSTLRTWVYFQKMAKEVEELLRAKESLSSIMAHLQNKDVLVSDTRRLTTGSKSVRGGSPVKAPTMSKAVDPEVVQELAQSTQDALQLAQAIIDSRVDDMQQGMELMKGGDEGAEQGARGSDGDINTSGKADDMSSVGTAGRQNSSSTPQLPSLHQGKSGLLGFLARDKSKGLLHNQEKGDQAGGNSAPLHSTLAALAAGAQAMTSPRSKEPVDKVQLRQAIQRVKQLHGTLDMVSSLYNDAYDQFQSVREEYENRVEECQFLELQCSRLDMHCHELADRLHGAGASVRAGIGSFSATGLSPTHGSLKQQKRSFSLSSLRDVNFWEQRFHELSQLTGIEEGDSQNGGVGGGASSSASSRQTQQHASVLSSASPAPSPASAPGTVNYPICGGLAKTQVLTAAAVRAEGSGNGVGPTTLSSGCAYTLQRAQLSHSTSLSALQLSSVSAGCGGGGCLGGVGANSGEDGRGPQVSERGRPNTERMVRRVASAPQLPAFGEICAGRPVLHTFHRTGNGGVSLLPGDPAAQAQAQIAQAVQAQAQAQAAVQAQAQAQMAAAASASASSTAPQLSMLLRSPPVASSNVWGGKQTDTAEVRPATFVPIAPKVGEKTSSPPLQGLRQPASNPLPSPAATPGAPKPGLSQAGGGGGSVASSGGVACSGGGSAGALTSSAQASSLQTNPSRVQPVSVSGLSTRSGASDGGHTGGGSSGSVSARSGAASNLQTAPAPGAAASAGVGGGTSGVSLSGGGSAAAAAGGRHSSCAPGTSRNAGTMSLSPVPAGGGPGGSGGASSGGSASATSTPITGGLRPLTRGSSSAASQRPSSRGMVRPRTVGSSTSAR